MSGLLANALWDDLRLGLLARSRAAHDEAARLHAAGDVDGVVRIASEAFAAREDNFKEAMDELWGRLGRRDLHREHQEKLAGRHADLVRWLYDVAVAHDARYATSRFFLDPALPDRVWVQRGTAWDLAWRHDGKWLLKSLKEVRAAADRIPPAETLLVVRVGGVERPNPRLPKG